MLYLPLHIYYVYHKRGHLTAKFCIYKMLYAYYTKLNFQGIELHRGLECSLRGKAVKENKIISSFSSAIVIKNIQ